MGYPTNEAGIQQILQQTVEDAELDLALGKNPLTQASFAPFLDDDDDDELQDTSSNDNDPNNKPSSRRPK